MPMPTPPGCSASSPPMPPKLLSNLASCLTPTPTSRRFRGLAAPIQRQLPGDRAESVTAMEKRPLMAESVNSEDCHIPVIRQYRINPSDRPFWPTKRLTSGAIDGGLRISYPTFEPDDFA